MAAQLITDHILNVLTDERPLLVALQGPQGSGKSYLASHVKSSLESLTRPLRVAVLSIDDLYLTHLQLVALAEDHPDNVLWRGRGQPGTHDLPLAFQVLSQLKSGTGVVELPRFDKSLYSGEGDRLPMDGSGTIIEQPPTLDVVILEGWCVGFTAIPEERLQEIWTSTWRTERDKLALKPEVSGRLEDLEAINQRLKDYSPLWALFDVFVQLKALPPASDALSEYSVIYQWRFEQEENMKLKNGGRGMSAEQVKAFVDRYIPGYVFFGAASSEPMGSDEPLPRWTGKGLILYIDENRTVSKTARF